MNSEASVENTPIVDRGAKLVASKKRTLPTEVFEQNERSELRATVAGPKRREKIDLWINGRPSGSFHVLDLNHTFAPAQMYLLRGMVRAASSNDPSPGASGDGRPQVELGFVRCYDGYGPKQARAQHEMVTALGQALRTAAMPSDIYLICLLNERHWLVLVLHLNANPSKSTFSVVNTINEARAMPLGQIEQSYLRLFGRALQRAFASVGVSIVFDQTRFRYAQGLQYGNMSCGFTTAQNVRALMNGQFVLSSRQVRAGDRVVRQERSTIPLEDGTTVDIFEDCYDPARSVDRSVRLDLIQDAQLRANLAADLSRRNQLASNLAARIRLKNKK